MNFIQNIVNIGSSLISNLSTTSTTPGTVSSESYPHFPSESDVHLVRYALQSYLPLELVDIIIEEAHYWPCISVEESTQVHAIASRSPNYSANWCYLLSPPIPGLENQSSDENGERRRKVRRVQIEIESHDQGWGGMPSEQGTYNGSWTWFEACIIRTSDENAPAWLRVASERPVNLAELSSREPSTNDFWTSDILVGPSTKRWHIQSNKTATQTKQFHSILWTDDAGEGIPLEDTWKGRRCLGQEVVSLLQPGDRVAILAKAQFPGWVNHVYHASIAIYYSM